MKTRRDMALVAGMACAILSTAAMAQTRVLIAAAATTSSTDCRFLDTQTKLMSTGLFSAVGIFNASAGTPTLAQLLEYDAVITWSNTQYTSAAAMGEVLADYADLGRGVVIATFANASIPLAGRWISGGYDPIISGSGQTSSAVIMGTVHEPSHPIMQGVVSVNGGTAGFRPTATNLAPGALRVADWNDGRALVVVGAMQNVVSLSLYPPSSDCRSDFWVSSSDGARLMGNALVFAAGGGKQPCYPNCDGSTVEPILNIDDFTCFINEYASAQGLPHEQQVAHYANCDGSTVAPALNIDDFTCFINEFATGCP